MPTVFAFPAAPRTDEELQLVRGARKWGGVSIVTDSDTARPPGLLARLEGLRARVERTISRQSLRLYDHAAVQQALDGLRDTEFHSTSNADSLRVVNLTGRADFESSQEAEFVMELFWDGASPEGLGQTRATDAPPRGILVTCRSLRGTRKVVERSTLTPTPATPAGDRRNGASRSIALLLRALRLSDDELRARMHAGELFNELVTRTVAVRGWAAVSASAGAVGAAFARRASRQLWRDDAWELQYRTNTESFVANSAAISGEGFRTYRRDYGRFVADPIAYTHNGVCAVFFEEYPYATRKGVISCAVLDANGVLGPSQRVLETTYHLSYPYVFRDGAHIYMIPESSANGTIDLYECTAFPYQWEFRQTLIQNISANDATLHHDGRRWWMFCTVSTEGAYAWDELHLFSSDGVLAEWTPHRANPVKCDARSSRPAGPLFVRDGRLIRPTQDCSETYGGAVNLCEIQELTETTFRETVVARVDPGLIPGMAGLHTLSAAEGIEVIDVRPARRMRWQTGTIRRAAKTPRRVTE